MKKIVPFLVASAIGFGAGYLLDYDRKYGIERIEGKAYLCNKQLKQCESITEEFQLGSLEYRIEGIKEEMRKHETEK